MNKYDVKCPACNHTNKDLYLEETEGRYICEKCGFETQLYRFMRKIRVPVYTPEQAAKILTARS